MPPTIVIILAANLSVALDELGKIADIIVPKTRPYELYNVPSSDCHKPVPHPPSQAVTKMDIPAHWPLELRPYRPIQRAKVCCGHIFYGVAACTCKPMARQKQ
ncbi:hypothetical protein SK128_008194, partial [Halocaridina rubra]